jgi:ribosomal protein L18E
MKVFTFREVVFVIGLTWIVGCGESSDATADAIRKQPVADPYKVVLTDEPDGALGVSELRELAKDDDYVVMVGRIGGATEPWVEGRAAFAVVDAAIKLCEGGVCACCKDKICDATALVKIVDEHGRLLKTDARELLNVKEDEIVVVAGKAIRDDAGNMTILASGVYVRR